MGTALRPYQVEGVRWIRERFGDSPACVLADEMGLGKTIQALAVTNDDRPMIVVSPAAMKGQWFDECRKWRPAIVPGVLEGRGSFRWPRRGQMVILNPAILAETEERRARGRCPEDTLLVVDEGHAFMNAKSQQTKRLRALRRDVVRRGGRCLFMTGTPLMNRQKELWTFLQSAGSLGDKVFGSWFRYMRLMGGKRGRFGTVWDVSRISPAVPEMLARVMLRRLKKDHLAELPAKTYTVVHATIEKATVRRELDRFAALLKDAGADPETATNEALATALDLVPFEEISRARHALALCKIPASLAVAKEFAQNDVPYLFASAHKAPVYAAAEAPGMFTIMGETKAAERTDVVRRFQAGEGIGVALSIRAAGVGLTLTRASNMVRNDRSWVPGMNEQCEDRMHRIGQENAVQIVDVVADHAIDTRLSEVTALKSELISKVVEGVAEVHRKGKS